MNAGHAALHEQLARYMGRLPPWIHAPEVSFAVYGERGVIDILAFHPPSGSLLVIELKTELISLEDVLSTMDVRLRHAAAIGRQRGWQVRTVSAWLVLAESATNRRRVRAHASALRSAFPSDGRAMRGWLRRPAGSIRALSFWANFNGTTADQMVAARRRVRVRRPRPDNAANCGVVEIGAALAAQRPITGRHAEVGASSAPAPMLRPLPTTGCRAGPARARWPRRAP